MSLRCSMAVTPPRTPPQLLAALRDVAQPLTKLLLAAPLEENRWTLEEEKLKEALLQCFTALDELKDEQGALQNTYSDSILPPRLAFLSQIAPSMLPRLESYRDAVTSALSVGLKDMNRKHQWLGDKADLERFVAGAMRSSLATQLEEFQRQLVGSRGKSWARRFAVLCVECAPEGLIESRLREQDYLRMSDQVKQLQRQQQLQQGQLALVDESLKRKRSELSPDSVGEGLKRLCLHKDEPTTSAEDELERRKMIASAAALHEDSSDSGDASSPQCRAQAVPGCFGFARLDWKNICFRRGGGVGSPAAQQVAAATTSPEDPLPRMGPLSPGGRNPFIRSPPGPPSSWQEVSPLRSGLRGICGSVASSSTERQS